MKAVFKNYAGKKACNPLTADTSSDQGNIAADQVSMN